MISRKDKGFTIWCFKQEQNRNKPRGNRYLNGTFENHRQALAYLLTICKAKNGLDFAYKENPFEIEEGEERVVISFRLFHVKLPAAIDTNIDPNRLAESIEKQFKEFTDDVRKELEKRDLKESAIRIAIAEGAWQLCLVVSCSTEKPKLA
jgi:hypothetical protein